MKNSKIYHGDQEQALTDAQETALVDAGIIIAVGDHLGRLEYAICIEHTWADVDAVLAGLVEAQRAASASPAERR
jgi:hypothetical protein